jgi:ribosomal protein L37AE/L43A
MCEPQCPNCRKTFEPKLVISFNYKAIWQCDKCEAVWLEHWSKHKHFKPIILIKKSTKKYFCEVCGASVEEGNWICDKCYENRRR